MADLDTAIRRVLREHVPELREPVTTRVVVALSALVRPRLAPPDFTAGVNNLSDAAWEIVEGLRTLNKDLRATGFTASPADRDRQGGNNG